MGKMRTPQTKTHTKNTLSKLLTVQPFPKNKNSDEVAFKHGQGREKAKDFSSQKSQNEKKKYSILSKSAHKLHSLHRSYNKGVETTF